MQTSAQCDPSSFTAVSVWTFPTAPSFLPTLQQSAICLRRIATFGGNIIGHCHNFFGALPRLSTAEAVVALEELKILHIFDPSLVMQYWNAKLRVSGE